MKIMETLRAVSPKKWLIIGISAGAALLILLGCLFLLPGGKTPTGGQVTPGDTVTVTVKNRADTPLENVQVYIYEDKSLAELVTFAKTDAEGKMSFATGNSGAVAVLKGLAAGYKAEAYYPLTGAETVIVLDALATTEDGSLPTDVRYSVGDPVMDFTVTDVDGNTYTASEVLKEKKALVLNFWYTACQPCQMEFPYLQAAYEQYKDSVLVLAMDPYTSDSADSIKAFRDTHQLTMPMVAADSAWVSLMNVLAYPTTVVIDRYGIITFSHTGAITEEGTFEKLFAFYGGEEYTQAITDSVDDLDDVIANAGNTGDSNSTTNGNGGSSNGGDSTADNSTLKTEFTGVLGTKNEPIEIGGTLTFSTEIPAGKESYFNVYRVGGTILTINSKTAQVEYDGEVYNPKNGKIEIPVETEDVTIPIKIIIRNTGTATEKYTVNFVYPGGTLENPYALKLGALTTDVAKGNDQGVTYIYKAPDNGIVEIQAISATNGVEYDVVLYNLNTYANRTLGEDGASKKVSIEVNKGDTLQVTVGVLPNKEHEYPAATIKSNVTFTPTAGPVTKPTLPSTATFSVTVKDDKGAAMAGVALKFEVGTQVKTVTTDKNGVASAVMDYGNCKATITVPAGYVAAKLSYNLTPDSPTALVVLEEDSWFDDPVDPEPPVDPDDPVDPEPPVDPDDPNDPDDPDDPVIPEPPVDPRVDYTVKVIDGVGAAQSGITVEFYSSSNALLDQQVTDANGAAVAKLDKGNYIIKLSGTTLKYDERAAVMTASKTTLELLVAPLYDNTVFSTVNCPIDSTDKDAYYLNEGATYVELTPGARNYFLFEPTRTGTFRFTTSNSRATIGYYGGPFFVLSNNAAEVENNAFTMSVSSVGPTYVVGVDAPTNISGVIVSITRIGEPGWSVENEPWITYEGTHVPTKFTLPAGTTLENVDITADSQEIVYNANDGYYHLNSADGPVLYLRFGKAPYLNITDLLANQGVRVYVYDTNGEFVKKEEYTTYLSTYFYSPHPTYDPTGTPVNMLDKEMVYPLNDDLIHILQTYAAHQHWDDPDSPNYLFKDADGEIIPGINNDIAWMFPLCYGVN